MSVGNMRACSRTGPRAVAACAAVVAVGVRNAHATGVDYTFQPEVAQVPRGYRCYTLVTNSDHKEVMFADYFDLMYQQSATLLDAFQTTFGGDKINPYILKHRAVKRGTAAQSPVAVCAKEHKFAPASTIYGDLTSPNKKTCGDMTTKLTKKQCLVKIPKAVLFMPSKCMMVSPVAAGVKKPRHFKDLLNADNADLPTAVFRLVGLAMKSATDHEPVQAGSAEENNLINANWKPNVVYLHTHGVHRVDPLVRLDMTAKHYPGKELKRWAKPRQAATKPPTKTPVAAPTQPATVAPTKLPTPALTDAKDATTNGKASTQPSTKTDVAALTQLVTDAPSKLPAPAASDAKDATTNVKGNLNNMLMSGLVVVAIVCGLVATYFSRCRPSKTHHDGAKDNLVVAGPGFSELSGRVLHLPELLTPGQ